MSDMFSLLIAKVFRILGVLRKKTALPLKLWYRMKSLNFLANTIEEIGNKPIESYVTYVDLTFAFLSMEIALLSVGGVRGQNRP
jgi:hypothetical protein